jgi:hypothetical protein
MVTHASIADDAHSHLATMSDEPMKQESPVVVSSEPREGELQPKWYRVMNGGYVNWDGAKTRVPAGKMYADNQVDIKALERQGIIFQEISAPE